jgi:hypothetical protein
VVLREGLKDPDPTIRRKVAFLINTLLLQSDETPDASKIREEGPNDMVRALKDHSVLETLVSSCTSPLPTGADGENLEPDWDFQEKVVRAVLNAAERGGLEANQKKAVGDVWRRWGSDGKWGELGFSQSEGQDVAKRLSA